ncbi:hypothetical protein ATANTOWER_023632 [Ataeniobius toweri]|uniref:Uncharacterized protein n=1 Tax=Ataeniobius toweri TaxID=208326 RepID=A0ABU7ABJ7_9TELE|nr:hypothetical protein [Ataeniobius toweri]
MLWAPPEWTINSSVYQRTIGTTAKAWSKLGHQQNTDPKHSSRSITGGKSNGLVKVQISTSLKCCGWSSREGQISADTLHMKFSSNQCRDPTQKVLLHLN